MLNDLNKFTIADLDEFQKLVFAKRNEPDYFLKLGNVITDNGGRVIHIKISDSLFTNMYMSTEDSKISSLIITGDFSITLKNLIDYYSNFRKAYSWYDGCDFYFFKEKTEQSCSITIFIDKKEEDPIRWIQLQPYEI